MTAMVRALAPAAKETSKGHEPNAKHNNQSM